ncbi:prominin-like protein [Drosophila mojavensis]|uniref:Uncharacterized protein, isoform A n=1 Tax=Drosophila mojavensis TaxID=7230 RepID=A0A0Q9XL28_DROMO|nr:prominin-like protein [Drosophila mojavensis]KRG05596.1 uncharacterized protein Dmoj_GI26182, isoform A [Drosophila mojavensis]KRG05597.1 uncharacterized protein Dmoj_GI26182, isoform B [Drosophila mojavensis]KRG05598.1 uncharacterized protein Dmoj_GI26182, isoform C [Drosophila mojavensis]
MANDYIHISKHMSHCKMRRLNIQFWAICGLSCMFIVAAIPPKIKKWDEERQSTHEHMGQSHFPPTVYSKYETNITYTRDSDPSTPITHLLDDFSISLINLTAFNRSIPPGYIVVKSDSLVMGPKVEENQWKDLLAEYWLSLLWVIFLIILIIVMPCVGVCYCCFCAWQRCARGCPTCDLQSDNRWRLGYGILLAFLLLGLFLGLLFAYSANNSLEHGFEYTQKTMRRGSEDTCRFLKDCSQHIHHLLVKNYQEMQTHLNDVLKNAHTHMFLDLMDISQANMLFDLELILSKLNKALIDFKVVKFWQDELLFYNAQLRDGVRGAKRDITYACTTLCASRSCLQFLKTTEIEMLDTSSCLHLDNLPDVKSYVTAVENMINTGLPEIPTKGIERVQVLGTQINEAVEPIIPPILTDLQAGELLFRDESNVMTESINGMINSIHFTTLRSTKSLEDVDAKFGSMRNGIHIIVLVVLTIIAAALMVALVFGCCTPVRRFGRDKFWSKRSGALCLLLAIILIFSVFWLTSLVGLFYYIFGMVTYQGVCAPLRDQENNSFFQQMDPLIDLNRFLPETVKNMDIERERDWEARRALIDRNERTLKRSEDMRRKRQAERETVPLRMSTAIKACEADESVFKLLRKNNVYNIDELVRLEVLTQHPPPKVPIFKEDIKEFVVLTEEEHVQLMTAGYGDLSDYHSSIFIKHLCDAITPVALPKVIQDIRALEASLKSDWGRYDLAKVSLTNAANNLERYHINLVAKIQTLMRNIKEKLKEIDNDILYEGLPFGDTMQGLQEAIKRSQEFIRNRAEGYIQYLRTNLTIYVDDEVSGFMERVMYNCENEVGKCRPLAYIYYTGVDLICRRLVYPMNGFWVGLLLSALILLPTLYVSHRLICLYNKMYPGPPQPAVQCRACGGVSLVADGTNRRAPICILHDDMADNPAESEATVVEVTVEPSPSTETIKSDTSTLCNSSSSKHKQD